ncbi:DUF5753 domain-containing protein [Actinomadura kijaniata]|uniref:DUF5753 domain-containing protein n=1 Tax=Actinomadura kijaniata TaxID=46161 RepID=UPI000B0559B7|nr:DUF5753 domain-containing protein [Actinomadura kijaniata]
MNESRTDRYAAVVFLLRRCHGVAGEPSYTTIAKVAGENDGRRGPEGVLIEAMGKSTANDILLGKHKRGLRWRAVETLWAVLHLIAKERGLDTADMVPRDELHRCYHAGLSAVSPRNGAPSPRAEDPGADRPDVDLNALCPGGPGGRAAQQAEVGRLLEEIRRRGSDAWWHGFRDIVPGWFGPYLTLEPELRDVHTYAARRVPGLLQTPDYARYVIADDLPHASAAELDRRVELRMRRRQVLHRTDPLNYWAVIDERVLEPGPFPGVLRDQVDHLIAMAEVRHVVVQVVRTGDAERIITAGPTTLLRFGESRYGDLVYLEQQDHGLYLHDNDDVAHFTKSIFDLQIAALPPSRSLELLREIRDRLQP